MKTQHLKLTFLGTGTSQGIPIIGSDHPVCLSDDPRDTRLRVSVLVQWENYNYVIDCGPDFRQQMLMSPLSRKRLPLHGILLTHEHADHVAGLDDIRPFVFRQGDMPIYAHKRVIANLEERFAYIFETKNKYPGAPRVETFEVDHQKNVPLKEPLKIVPILAYHGELPIFGYRFDKMAYLTDVKTIDALEIEKLQGLDILVINALRYEPHTTHLNVEEALQLVDKINPKTTYSTHISHHLGFHAQVEKQLPKNVYLAYDGLTLSL